MRPVSQTSRQAGAEALPQRAGYWGSTSTLRGTDAGWPAASRLGRSHVPFSPVAQPEKARTNRPPTLGQLVEDAERRPVEHGPVDQAGPGQLIEAVRQHALADPGNRPRQHGKPRRTLQQQAEDDARPALAQQIEGLRQSLITLARLGAQRTIHAVSVAPPANYCRNLRKVSSGCYVAHRIRSNRRAMDGNLDLRSTAHTSRVLGKTPGNDDGSG